MRRVRVALGLCLMQDWGECEVRELLNLMKSRWAARAAGGEGCRTVVRTSLYVGQLEWVVTWRRAQVVQSLALRQRL